MIVVGLLVGVGIVAFALVVGRSQTQAQQNRQRLEDQQRIAKAVCAEDNASRLRELKLWDLFIKEARQHPDPRLSRKQVNREIGALQSYVNTTFAHVNCDNPSPAPSPVATPTTLVGPVITRIVTDTKTRTQTVFVRVPVTRVVTRTVVVCQRPNGRAC